MRKMMCAGAVALATVVSSFAIDAARWPSAASEVTITDAQIGRFKSALRLNAEQQRHWAPVEATLRDIMRRKTAGQDGEGLVQRVKSRVRAVMLDAQELHRLGSAARPLIHSLDAEQKAAAMRLVQAMGFGTVMAAF